MKTDTKAHLLAFLQNEGPSRPSVLASSLDISLQMVHRHLKTLLSEGKIRKQGSPPKVLYFSAREEVTNKLPSLPPTEKNYIDEHYLFVKPDGEILEGLNGFQSWAIKTHQHKNFNSLAREYITLNKDLEYCYRNKLGVIDATFKIKETFDRCYLDHLFYQEFYSIPKFGKTKMGQMIFLGKSGQNLRFIRLLAELSRASIIEIINHYQIDGVIFAPHSIPRKIPFLKMFEKFLGLKIPVSTLKKVFVNNIPIAQKSLSKLADRIENASNTIFTQKENSIFKRILVIDDAVGSGATLNIIAEKLKKASRVTFVCGYALTGSLKGFEVINEI